MPHPEGFDRKDKSNPWIFFRSLLLEILYGGETSKNQDFRKLSSEKGDEDFTYYYSIWKTSEDCELLIEMLSRQLGGLSNGLSNPLGKQRQRRKNQRKKWESRVFEVIKPG